MIEWVSEWVRIYYYNIILFAGLGLSLNALYLGEISPKKIRGAVGTCQQLSITIGILTSNILGVSKIFGKYVLLLFHLIFINVGGWT